MTRSSDNTNRIIIIDRCDDCPFMEDPNYCTKLERLVTEQLPQDCPLEATDEDSTK